MMAGIKTFDSAINVDPNGNEVVPIGRELQEQGYKVGIVTSVPFPHATPACAYANNVSRDDYQDISRDLLGLPSKVHPKAFRGMDVVIGCGWGEEKIDDRKKQGDDFIPGNVHLSASDLKQINVEHGGKYVVATRTTGERGKTVLDAAAERAARDGLRLFGFFGHQSGHLPYQTADGNFDPTRGATRIDVYTKEDIAENPTLADMTRAALKVVENNDKGFWLMIEAGDVDWANHNNNIDDSIGAVFSGEEAFEAVTEWVESNSNWDETAVIVTSDHGHYLVVTDPHALAGESTSPLEADGAASASDK
jgi:alkaline phosphatase